MSLSGKKRRRQTEIKQKRRRRVKFRKLVARSKNARNESDKATVIAKLLRLNPTYQIPQKS